jgi:hypothetical protein
MPLASLRAKYQTRSDRRARTVSFLEEVRSQILEREPGLEVTWHTGDEAPGKEITDAIDWKRGGSAACVVTLGINVLGTPEIILVPLHVVDDDARNGHLVFVAGNVAQGHRTASNVAYSVILHADKLVEAYLATW